MKSNNKNLPAHVDKQTFSDEKLFSFPSHPPKLNIIHFPELELYHHLGINARQNPFDIGNLHISLLGSETEFNFRKYKNLFNKERMYFHKCSISGY